MKKILLVLFTLVLCLSSFKGMGQDPINGLCEPTIEFINLSQNLNTDVVGQWHNDFLDFLFEKIKTDNICPMDESFNFKYNSFVHEFMQTKGLELNNNLIGSIYDINSLEKINLCNEESSEATKHYFVN